MKNVDIEELIDKAMAGRLSAEEEARWVALVAERPDLAENLALANALRRLPPPPRVSSNFTALVLQQLNQPHAPVYENPWVAWLRWRGFAKLTGAAAVFAVGFMALQHQRQAQMEKTVRTFAGLVSAVAPNQTQIQSEGAVSVLKDFEAIRQLPDAAAVDYGLLAALGSNDVK
jgi:hypothetical protein